MLDLRVMALTLIEQQRQSPIGLTAKGDSERFAATVANIMRDNEWSE